jgi:uncharacterized CHY-type Zn-finger protein
MKILFEAQKIDGVKQPQHEIEILCANCEDPVSQEEEASGTCTNCNQPWNTKQNLSIWVTSVPAAGAKSWGT